MTTNLVVADLSRTEKTICMAVTPSLKSYGVSGRARLFEVVQKVKEVNNGRRYKAPRRQLEGASSDDTEIKSNPKLALDYIVAPPRMAHYMEYSTRIYNVYLKYMAPEDIYVYSIDEVFIDLTHYLGTYKKSAHDMAQMIIKDVLMTTGITATAGIGKHSTFISFSIVLSFAFGAIMGSILIRYFGAFSISFGSAIMLVCFFLMFVTPSDKRNNHINNMHN